MSTEDNMATARRLIEEVWNQGKVALINELCAPNFILHDPDRPDVRTLEDYKRWVTETRSAFPNFRLTIEGMFAKGEEVADRWTLRGTNTGDLVTPTMRIPATGKQVTVTGLSIVRFAGGKAVEHWHLADYLGLFQQLGLIPVPEPVG
ncbi:MAG TPA: ester cyclase [Ktedonobacteraceae bacterium]